MAVNPRARRRRSHAHRSWPGPRPSPANDPRPPRRRRPPAPEPEQAAPAATLASILDDFTESWSRGEPARLEAYLDRLDAEDMVELIYREYCLAEESDLDPDPSDYLRRFPDHSSALERLFALHSAVSASSLRRLVEPTGLPEAGDSIGPYFLARELGRGAFARVFLAHQEDLGNRPVVLKVSTRPSSEPSFLARARHAHIVEVFRHEKTDDGALHLVSMPFLGGATLAAVLDSRRKLGRRPRTGRDLLADLDRVSAPEYPDAELSRPAREIVARLSHARAVAWFVARLAEALDHAYRRGVSHGDLKPSNILLTAEGTPMLFDFNLAVDWRDADGPVQDAGGTMTYMAPERLMAIAGGLEAGRRPDRHRADLYAIGLILLEALTGRAPESPRIRKADHRRAAQGLAESRRTILREAFRGRQARSIPAALRSILTKCLAPDPLDRYGRGNELAEDLDNWRADRPLRFAVESRRSELARQLRNNRVPLVAMAITLATALGVSSIASLVMEGTRRDRAVAKLANLVDRPDSGALTFSNQADRCRIDGGPVDPAELSGRLLDRYDILTDPGWRDRDDVRALPDRDRSELEAWMLEHSYRLVVALGQRPDSPSDWRRALTLLDQTLATNPSPAMRAERRALAAKLKLPEPGPEPASSEPPRWLDSYLAGVAAERDHARAALGLYEDAIRDRPDFFWAHYRAACAASRVDEIPVAIGHIRYCVGRRPRNPMLHAQLGSMIFWDDYDNIGLGRKDRLYEEALAECDRALALAPDLAEATAIRAKILHASGQTESALEAVDRFGLLRRLRGLPGESALRWEHRTYPGPNASPDVLLGLGLQRTLDNPDDLEARALLADGLLISGRTEEALAEFDRVLEANPGHVRARLHRASEIYRTDPATAIAEYARLVDSPRIEEVFRENPTAIRAFHFLANDLLTKGKVAEALDVAQRSLQHVHRSRSFRADTLASRSRTGHRPDISPRGETYYVLARIQAKLAETQPDQVERLLETLERCFECNIGFRDKWLANDRRFDALRPVINERFKGWPVLR